MYNNPNLIIVAEKSNIEIEKLDFFPRKLIQLNKDELKANIQKYKHDLFLFKTDNPYSILQFIDPDEYLISDQLFFVTENETFAEELMVNGLFQIFDNESSIALKSCLKKYISGSYIPFLNSDEISLIFYDENHRIMHYTEKAEREFNLDYELVHNMPLEFFLPSIDFSKIKYFTTITTSLLFNGDEIPVLIRFHKLYQNSNNYQFITIKKEEFWLKKSPNDLITESQYNSIVNHTSEVIMRFNRKKEHIFVNDAVISVVGLEPKDFIGKTHKQMGFPEHLVKTWDNAIDKTFESREPQKIAFEIDGINGHQFFEWSLIPEFDKDGNVETVITLTKDFTRRRNIEETHARLAAVVNQVRESIFITDLDGRIIYANKKFLDSTGYSLQEILYKNPRFLNSGLSDDNFYKDIWKTIKNGKVWNGRLDNKKKNGMIISEEATIFPIFSDDNEIVNFASVRRDITQKLLQEEQIQKLAKFPDENPYPVVRVAKSGGILYSNSAGFKFIESYLRKKGWKNTIEKIIDTNSSMMEELWSDGKCFLLKFVPVKDSNYINIYGFDITKLKEYEKSLWVSNRRFQDLQDNVPIGLFRTDRNGKFHSVNNTTVDLYGFENKEELLNSNVVDRYVKPELREELLDILNNDEVVKDYELELYRKDGSKFWGSFQIKRVRERDCFYQDGSIKDITTQKETEKKLRQAQKMEAIGTLAGGIAHDFNNILMAIIGFAEITLSEIDPKSNVYENVERILLSGQRAKEMVKQLLAFSRQSTHSKTEILLQKCIKEAVGLLSISFPSNIEIKTNIERNCGYIYADPTQINQVLMNLGTNARHAMKNMNGELIISLVSHNQEESEGDLLAGEYVKLVVSDTGTGMTNEVKSHLFEPFFTTKDVNEGTGLGLATVHGIVSQSDAVITVESELGKGTSFNIYFPIVKEKFSLKKAKVEKEKLINGAGNILLVDDEIMVGNLLKKVLQKVGYNVDYFSKSPEALEVFTSNPEYFNLIITDQTMPLITGNVLAESILEIRKDVPIIICSGYSEEFGELDAKKIGIKHFLTKPVSIGELTSVVKRFLDEE